ncbi:MAG: flagellar M-ring protein FliF [Labilithrix sp.]|nr:flagellar M-ring protein FliF [Labilithrix sp.]
MSMSKPARVLVLSTVAAALVIGATVAYRSTETSWATLFSNLDREDAASIVAKLKEMKIPYRVEGDGGSIEVPEAKVREVRLELAGAGLPRGGGVGFESFDKLRLGATEFEQRVLYRRALEGELARTIDTIAVVQSSRVHLVLPERSVFVGRSEPASASVVLKVRAGRALGAAEVAGVVHLVSSSVAGLAPERVAVVTTSGTVLHKPRREGEAGGAAGDDEQSSSARSLEATLEERARAMLEKVVGAGHVDVRVSADLEHARIERVEDRYDPKTPILRSEQSTTERAAGDTSVTGVPGAESNLPDGASKPGAGEKTDGILRQSHTRNFEVDHVTEKRLITSGTLRRLTVAVVVDGGGKDAGRSREEMERLTSLVRSAVGADEKRGDVVTVEAVPFLEPPPADPAPPKSPFQLPARVQKYVPHAIGAAAGLSLLVALLIVRRWRRRARAAKAAAAIVIAEPDIAPPEDPGMTPEELRARAHDRAADDPATAALVLRFWLGESAPRAGEAEGTRIA